MVAKQDERLQPRARGGCSIRHDAKYCAKMMRESSNTFASTAGGCWVHLFNPAFSDNRDSCPIKLGGGHICQTNVLSDAAAYIRVGFHDTGGSPG